MDFYVDLSGGKLQNKLLDDINEILKKTEEIEMDTDNDAFILKTYDENAVKEIKKLLKKYKK